MRRELIVGQQCEHITKSWSAHTDPVITPCLTRHNDRTQGAPQQLVPVKEGRMVRFVCVKHASIYKGGGVYRRVKKAPPPEQQSLV